MSFPLIFIFIFFFKACFDVTSFGVFLRTQKVTKRLVKTTNIRGVLQRCAYIYTSKMRLLAHNMLACNVKGVVNGYPLTIHATKIETNESEFNGNFIVHMLGKLDWRAFLKACKEGNASEDLPEEIPSRDAFGTEEEQYEMFLRKVHHALLEVTVVEGHLECPESGRKFPIENTIPNMLLNEDEV